MRIFISNVDTALGHHLSRVFHASPVTLRHNNEDDPSSPEDPDQQISSPETDNPDLAPKEKIKDFYTIQGTLTTPEMNAFSGDHKSIPGAMVYTGDKKRDGARKEAVEKFSVLGGKPGWVEGVVESSDREKLKESLLGSDVVIYDLMNNLEEAVWAAEFLSENVELFNGKQKVFILVSTIMTWARTKMEQDDSDAFLTEEEYRRRKPHPNFKTHISAEKSIMKCGKKGALKTYVVASGLVYHSGDSIFHYLLKAAWHNTDLTCYGDGSNTLPTIHIDDLCNILFELSETQPEQRYILAVDDSKNTLFEITKSISEALGTSKKPKKISKESALLNKSLRQSEYDMLLVNLRLEPGHVKDMSFEWKYEQGLIDNLAVFVQEYKDARGLLPLKIIIHGPPGSGKSLLSAALAGKYDVHLIDVEQVVNETMARLEKHSIQATAAAAEGGDGGDEGIEADKELWEEIQDAIRNSKESQSQQQMPGSGGQGAVAGGVSVHNYYSKVPSEYVITFLKEKLMSMMCKNQGYILDGFPHTYEEAILLLKSSTEEEEKGNLNPMDPIIAPEFVISLEVSDSTIKDRNMNIPETLSNGSKYSEEVLTKRLEDFRQSNTDENTVLNYYDEHEVHPVIINIEQFLDKQLAQTSSTTYEQLQANMLEAVEKVVVLAAEKIGVPRNYGPTIEQLEMRRRQKEEQLMLQIAAAEEDRIKKDKDELEKHNKSVTEWNFRLEEVRKQEQEVLEAQSVPLRNYLMKHVMPTLTSGLIDVCKIRPEDPIDYLAEYLFKV